MNLKLVSLWDLMALLENEAIFRGLAAAAQLASKWDLERASRQPFAPEQFEFFVETFRRMGIALGEAGLPLSADYARRIVGALQSTDEEGEVRVAQGRSRAELEEYLMRLVKVLPDEAAVRLFVAIPPELCSLYEASKPPFGEDVERVFRIAIDDIRDAGSCLALGQGTATVFHLMRVMEAGLRGLAAELGIPYAPSWESYLAQMKPKLDGKNYGSLSPEQKAKRPFYQDIVGSIESIKSAWRNPTMHIVRSYSPAHAKVIYDAVEGLMRRLAEELEPVAIAEITTGPSPVATE